MIRKVVRNFIELMVLIAIVFAFIVSPHKVSAAGTSIYLSPSGGEVSLGGVINVDILVNSSGNSLIGARASVNYSADNLEFQGVNVENSEFPIENYYEQIDNKIILERGGLSIPDNSGLFFAKLTFKVTTNSGEPSVVIDKDDSALLNTNWDYVNLDSVGSGYFTVSSGAGPNVGPPPNEPGTSSPPASNGGEGSSGSSSNSSGQNSAVQIPNQNTSNSPITFNDGSIPGINSSPFKVVSITENASGNPVLYINIRLIGLALAIAAGTFGAFWLGSKLYSKVHVGNPLGLIRTNLGKKSSPEEPIINSANDNNVLGLDKNKTEEKPKTIDYINK